MPENIQPPGHGEKSSWGDNLFQKAKNIGLYAGMKVQLVAGNLLDKLKKVPLPTKPSVPEFITEIKAQLTRSPPPPKVEPKAFHEAAEAELNGFFNSVKPEEIWMLKEIASNIVNEQPLETPERDTFGFEARTLHGVLQEQSDPTNQLMLNELKRYKDLDEKSYPKPDLPKVSIFQNPRGWARHRAVQKRLKKLEKEWKAIIMRNMVRKAEVIEVNSTLKATQTMKRGEWTTKGLQFTENRANPSMIDSTNRKPIHNNTNMGVVKVGKTIAAFRSGKSDTEYRMRENLLHTFQELQQAGDSTGITFVDGVYRYRGVIETHLDPSRAKALGPDNERKILKKIGEGAQAIRINQEPMTVTVNGQEVQVILEEPVVIVQRLSATANPEGKVSQAPEFVTGARDEFRLAWKGRDQLNFERLEAINSNCSDLTKVKFQVMKGKRDALFKKFDIENQDMYSLMKSNRLWESKEFQEYQKSSEDYMKAVKNDPQFRRNPSEYKDRAIELLEVEITHTFTPRDPPNPTDDILRRKALSMNLALAGYNGLVCKPIQQCKSGDDRTIVSIALNTAMEMFYQETGKVFNHIKPLPADLVRFKELYTKTVIRFGANQSVATKERGQMIRWGQGIAKQRAGLQYLVDSLIIRESDGSARKLSTLGEQLILGKDRKTSSGTSQVDSIQEP